MITKRNDTGWGRWLKKRVNLIPRSFPPLPCSNGKALGTKEVEGPNYKSNHGPHLRNEDNPLFLRGVPAQEDVRLRAVSLRLAPSVTRVRVHFGLSRVMLDGLRKKRDC